MKVAVLGAGAIGAYVGAALHRAGVDVRLIARGPHLAALRQDGVRVLSPRGDFAARTPATDDPAEVGPVDYVFLGLKANSYAACGPLLEPLLKPGTAVVAAQNGIPWWYFHRHGGPHDGRRLESVDPGGAVSAVIAPERVIGCVVYAATELEAPGVVRHLEGTRFSVGEPDRSVSARCTAFGDAMVAGGLKCPVEPDLRDDIWVKLLGNATFNPISALTRATMRQMCVHGGTRRVVETMMTETLSIAEALGCTVGVTVERRLAGAERVGDHRTSTLQDLERGKPLELDVLLTALTELADLTGVEAPTLRTVHALSDLLALRSAA
ncbi:2-dehydropantoate 2-reductase [Streptomyces abyssomicinicus]|uniref:2-dehydropantoate 2-reductase n=1 Tax=Streptomyces abyssomicinicus TaxID=574929 RepID=UPI0012504F30|nr:2-dehydropantoate 2-reductase [Streptomyces abyssomicinicus]